ncbi:pyridoxine 5'-phosphate synthase, partial [Escherichia coli]|uniref:pyridoxine 5'-phosphate synthase n=1 Tax=Escherichia coli TaxID=562 RepID=UPI0020249F00
IKAAAEVGAPFIELHTGCYADAKTDAEQAQELARIAKDATFAASRSLKGNTCPGRTHHTTFSVTHPTAPATGKQHRSPVCLQQNNTTKPVICPKHLQKKK